MKIIAASTVWHTPLSLKLVELMRQGPGRVTAQMQIEKHHTNRLEILHGGTISTMIDLGGCSSFPLNLDIWLTSVL